MKLRTIFKQAKSNLHNLLGLYKIIIASLIIFISLFSIYQIIRNNGSKDLILYGNVDIRDVDLGFRVSGRIAKVNFEEGDVVKKGEILAVLDQEPFEEALALRKAEVAEAMAALNNAEKLYQRRLELVKTGSVSIGAYDDALAARDEARARLETMKAKFEQTNTKFEDTEILAVNDGIVLTRVREPGSIVAAGDPVLTIALNDPVWVRTYTRDQ